MIIEYSFSIQFQNVCSFLFFRGQAKIVMNPTQHSSQFPIMLNQNNVPIQNQLNRFVERKLFSYTNYDKLPVLYVVYFDISANSIKTFQLFAFL